MSRTGLEAAASARDSTKHGQQRSRHGGIGKLSRQRGLATAMLVTRQTLPTDTCASGNPYQRPPPAWPVPWHASWRIRRRTLAEAVISESVSSPGGAVHIISRNLTPDSTGRARRRKHAGGIHPDHEDRYRLRSCPPELSHQHSAVCLLPPLNGDLLQVMPWPNFQGMTDRQLTAIYIFLSAHPLH